MLPQSYERRSMMLDYVLERFPLSLKLRDGTPVTVRPLGRTDEARLHQFLLGVPEEERLFIKQPIQDRTTIREWCRHPDFERNLPLLMLHGQKVVAEATLHQRLGGWKRHIGLITMLTHTQYRGRDISKVLISELVDISRHCGLRRLEVELNGERKILLNALAQLGFSKLLHLPDYVLDMQAVPHDYVLMGMALKVDEEYAGVG
jgi:GNAT superfamily N-acetyltransferase